MVISILAAALVAAAPVGADCRRALLPAPTRDVHTGRPVEAIDLARLRDFGSPEASVGGDAPFSVSPDGRLAAMVLRRADPSRDAYCMGVLVVPLDGTGPARLVDVGGDFIPETSDVRGIADLPIGTVEPVTPRWSPDGRWLAYLRRDHGLTRAWRAHVDGAGAEPVSRFDIDIRAVRWSDDGRALIVRTRPGLAASEAAIAEEEKKGFLYDHRFWTLSLARPKPSADTPEVDQRIDPEDGHLIGPGQRDSAEDSKPKGAMIFARSARGGMAWTSPDDPDVLLGPAALKIAIGGRSVVCQSSLCADGVGALWWGKGDELFFLQGGTSTNGGATTLARWRPGRDPDPSIILSTTDALFGCQPAGDTIVCARETATHPRVLARVDGTGTLVTLYDPNREFAGLKKGEVRRLRWKDADGIETYGDLVLPPDHKAGTRHPLIVVQYRSRGFLRGGTGDEYPIYALASRGFAVLSIERTQFFAAGKTKSFAEFMRMGTTDFAERRRVLSSVETGVQTAIGLGVADARRIGITGVSDGAATVQFALVNSDLFSAAAVSSCCDEPSTSLFAADRGYSDMLIDAGFPEPGTDGDRFWRRYSLAANAARLQTPILMQLSDDEFRFGLETYVTLDRHHVPVEMYVYAGEYHQKWRPAHRLSSYERAIDWFDFWLNGRSDPAVSKQAQYARWRALQHRQPR